MLNFFILSFLSAIGFLIQSLLMPIIAHAAYTSLVSSSDFTAIAADVSTAVAGIISIALIILGASLLMRAFGK